MALQDKYFDAVFYAVNKTRFDEFLSFKEKTRAENNAPLLEVIPPLVEELDTFGNKESDAQKDFYSYYTQFSPIKHLRSSQKTKIKLARDYLTIILRKLQNGEKLPVSLRDFWHFYLHKQCAEFFEDHWFLLENKYTFFSQPFMKTLLKKHVYLHGAIETLENVPPVFLPMTDDKDLADSDRTFHRFPTERAAEMLAEFNVEEQPETVALQARHWAALLQKASDDTAYLLLLY